MGAPEAENFPVTKSLTYRPSMKFSPYCLLLGTVLTQQACGSSKPHNKPDTQLATPAGETANRAGRESVAGTIELLIQSLRAKEYRAVFEQFLDPKDVAKFKERSESLDEMAKEFGDSDKPQRLLTALLAVQGTKPTFSEKDTLATFPVPPGVDAPRPVKFKRVDGRWYIKN